MVIPKDKVQLWCDQLRSGNWRQGKEYLQTTEGGFCCLGVACMLFTPMSLISLTGGKRLFGKLPSDQKYCPDWLKRINEDFKDRTGFGLDKLNDKGLDISPGQTPLGPFTFDEIADLLEAVYIHEVLY